MSSLLFNFCKLNDKLHFDMSIFNYFSFLWLSRQTFNPNLNPNADPPPTPRALHVHMMRGSLGNKGEACKACLSRPFVYILAM